jgi:hypothetical protein
VNMAALKYKCMVSSLLLTPFLVHPVQRMTLRALSRRFGGARRNRTLDRLITNRVLCLLSYRAPFLVPVWTFALPAANRFAFATIAPVSAAPLTPFNLHTLLVYTVSAYRAIIRLPLVGAVANVQLTNGLEHVKFTVLPAATVTALVVSASFSGE